MEACMMKPEVKKKPKPPKPPPKPTEVKRNEAERDVKPAPLIPPRPTDAQLTHTQYRMNRSATSNKPNGNIQEREAKVKLSQVPVAAPRLAEKEPKAATRHERPRNAPGEADQPEAAADETDFKRSNQSGLTGMFQRSQKEKTPTFTSYMTDVTDQEEKSDEVPVKQAPSNKPASREASPDPGAEETSSEKEQLGDKNKEQHNTEHKQDKGGLLGGMFRKTPKERSSSPALKVSKADSDSEDVEEDEEEEKTSEPAHERGGFFSGILKKSHKPADETFGQDNKIGDRTELSTSSDSLSDNNKEKSGIFSGIFRKSPKSAESDQDQQSLSGDLSESNDNLIATQSKDKGFFNGILRKSPKIPVEGKNEQDKEVQQSESSASNENLSENTNVKEKTAMFGGMFKRSPKPSEASQLEEGDQPLHGELSASSDSQSENKEKGIFFGLLRKTPKSAAGENLAETREISGSSDSLSEPASRKKTQDDELSGSEGPNENPTKEKGGIFGGMFKKTPKSAAAAQSEEESDSDNDISASNENVFDNKQERGGGLFSGLLRKTPRGEKNETPDREAQRELSASTEELTENNKERNIFSNMFKKTQKPSTEGATKAETDVDNESQLSASSENLADTASTKEKKGGLYGIFKRSSSLENLVDEDKNIFSGMFKRSPKPAEEGDPAATDNDAMSIGSSEDLLEATATKEKSGGLAGLFKKSPKPSPRSVATQDPLTKQLSASLDNITEAAKEDGSSQCELSASTKNLCDTSSTTKEKRGGFSGMFRRTPKNPEQQEGEDAPPPTGRGLSRKRTIKKKRRVVSFRVKKTLPKVSNENSSKMPLIEESVEMEELNAPQENTVVVEPVEMAAYPTEESLSQAEQENNELIEWWNSVKGWTEWNESSNFQEEDEQMAMEQAADRVYMAARVFVHLFNQQGASLQQRILELLSVADAADEFHKKTVSAAVGGGVASVAGSVATITGLILAPFTFGASIIVTAVGIGVATAGSITSATANITDTVHSNMDRKKVEKMIQGYQEEIQDIRKCMEFVQEGMNTLEEWDFEKYSQSAAKKALNHNIKHVMKEGGRAGKALMINTDKLISTVQVLGAAGGAAKAAQAISVTTGVMSALFLALDVFFLAKDSHELRKGAKTKFAGKIRQVCKDLQDGLLELNKVKAQLQKTMDGIEVEEYEEIEEVEVEDEFESDPKKLAELEQEIDFLEEKLDKKDKKEDVEPKKSKETALDIFKIKKEKNEEKSMKEKNEGEKKGKETSVKTVKEKVSKKDKESENQMTVGKEKKSEKKQEKSEEEPNRITENKKKAEKEQKGTSIRSGDPEKDKSLTPHGDGEKTQKKTEMSEPGGGSSRRHQSRSKKDEENKVTRERKEERGGESWRRRGEEERGVKDWREEMMKNQEEKQESKEKGREDPSRRKDSHQSHRGGESPKENKTIQHGRENEERKERGDDKQSSRVESARKRFERAAGDQQKEEEEGRQRRKEERESQRRRGSDREHGHSRKGSRSKYEALRHDGLNI